MDAKTGKDYLLVIDYPRKLVQFLRGQLYNIMRSYRREKSDYNKNANS